MSFKDPVKVIDHIPPNIDMKRITPKRPLSQRKKAKQARQNVEPFSCEKTSPVAQAIAFIIALGTVFAALITGIWNR